jgi:biopolymer transport protein ExbD
MASTQDQSENPVAINVVPMVDVIFCLCVFFMCSMKFTSFEGRFRSWLPMDQGSMDMLAALEEIRVAVFRDADTQTTRRQFGKIRIEDDAQLQELIQDAYAGWLQLGRPETPLIIDAEQMVPWQDVVNVMNLAKRAKVDKIQFAAGKDYEAPARR